MKRTYVDASGWLAYLDTNNPAHNLAKKVIMSPGIIITSVNELERLSYLAFSRVSDMELSSLTWNLWSGQTGMVLKPTAQEEMNAWEIFLRSDDKSFSDCLSLVLLEKYEISGVLSFSNWWVEKIDQIN